MVVVNFLIWAKVAKCQQSYVGKPAELGGISPPEFFLISTPPLQEGLSWAKYSPPRKDFWANYLKISPPRKNIFGKFQENSGILVKSCKGYPPLWGWKIYPPPKNFQKNIPPLWNFRNLSPPWESGACPRMQRNIASFNNVTRLSSLYFTSNFPF